MASEGVKRKLTAIFSADVEGYSLLMGEDELATVETLTSYKQTMRNLITHYRGRVVDSTGDNMLAEFASVVDAVQCAVEVQQVIASKNEDLPENRRMRFRIGINLGDVIEEEDRIYGDGVNIAARVESLADGGGICISGSAFEQIENKLALGYQYMGEHSVKNIVKPIKVYKVPMEPGAVVAGKEAKKPSAPLWRRKGILAGAAVALVVLISAAIWNFYFREPPIEPASVEKMAHPLPDKPSIAVLPFKNLGGDREQEYLADGITENIITALSKTPKMFVIASNSVFTYKGKPIKVQQVAEDMGVRYVLEGSLQKSGDRLRVNAQLIDALKGHHLWAERYDRRMKDIFAIQDEITMKIVTAMEVKLTQGEAAFAHAKGTNNLEAYLKDLRGREHLQKLSKDDNMIARKLLEEAIALDPDFPSPYVGLAYTYMVAAPRGWSDSPKSDFKKAFELAQKALALDDSLDMAHALLGRLYSYRRQYEKGISEGKKAIALGPGNSGNMAMLAITLRQAGMSEEAVKWAEKAVRINPRPPLLFMAILGYVYADAGRYEDAIKIFKKVLQQNPNYDVVPVYLPAVQMLAGHEKEGRAAIEELLKKNPKLCVKSVQTSAKRRLFKSEDIYAYLVEGLRKAGLPETPPLPLPDKPSIAVLPFVNMSGDPKQEYFSDGIAEEIITALSKVPKLFVIARHSSFTYKGKPIWVPTLGRELGVRYVLEGSVRRAANKVRITAQLIDAKTNHHLWAERYDRDLKDVFAVQDEISKKIITSLQVKLTEGEQARVFAKGTNNLEAYLKLLKGREQMNRFNKEGNALARKTIEEAIALDPQYPAAYLLLSMTHFRDVVLKSTSTPKKSLAKSIELAQKAVALDGSLAQAYGFLAVLLGATKQYDKAMALAERAVALNPNSAAVYMHLGGALNYSAGKHEEAIAAFKKALRFNPFPPLHYLIWLAVACRDAGRYEEAISNCKNILKQEPDYLFAHTCLASCYALMDKDEKARAEAAEVLRVDPKFSVDYIVKRAGYKYDIDRKRLRDSLLKAGLPH